MGGGKSKIKELEDRNAILIQEIETLQGKLKKSENDIESIKNDHENTLRELNETREFLFREQEILREREAEADRLRMSGVEQPQIDAMTNQIAKDRQQLLERQEQFDKKQEDALRQQGQLLVNLSEEYARDKKNLIDTQNNLYEKQAIMIQLQKTMPAKLSVQKLLNTAKSAIKGYWQHARNPSKQIKEMEIFQRDLDRQVTEVKSFMMEGHVTIDALTAFADAALLNIRLLEFLEINSVVDDHAVEFAMQAHQDEFKELMSVRREIYPLTDQQSPEIENIFYNRFREGYAVEFFPMPSASGGGEGGPSQELALELYQCATALVTTLEEGLETGRFDMEGDTTNDQDTTAE